MDNFTEFLVERKKTPLDVLISVLYYVLAIIISFFVIPLRFLGGFNLLVVAALFYLAYLGSSLKNIEFEYIFTNGEIDIDKIVSRKKRKRIISFKCRDIAIMADVLSKENPMNKTESFLDLSSNDENNKRYYAVINKGGNKAYIIFEPHEKMLNYIKTYNPKNVFI